MPDPEDEILGRMAVAFGLATPAQVDEARRTQRAQARPAPLLDLLAARGVLSATEAARVAEAYRIATGRGPGVAAGAPRAVAPTGFPPTPATAAPVPVAPPPPPPALSSTLLLPAADLPPASRSDVVAAAGGSVTLVEPTPGADGSGAAGDPPGTPRTVAGAAAPRPAPSILGHFEILGEIGRGGMGVVHRARQLGLDRIVALKLMAGRTGSGEEVERFRREAQAAARLHHPGIVEVYDVGTVDGRPYLAMEFIDGCALDRFVERAGCDLRARADLVRRVADAVEAAHAQGIVHRDLKPGNVLVDRGGNPHVADFGLAKELAEEVTELTESGVILGTPHYMSPEQADAGSRRVDARSDVFSLGVILYQLLTGRRPFEADRPVAVIAKILAEEVVPPRRWNPRVHADLETVCLRALEKERERRYPSAGALARDLGHFLAGEPIEARPATPLDRAWKRVRRNPGLSALAVALAVTLLAAAVAAGRAAGRERAAEAARRELVAGYTRELARSGRALVDAALARRALGDLAGSAAHARALDEPIAELILLAPDRADPWYHRGRMARALDRPAVAEAAQERAFDLAQAAGAAPESRAVLALARYERGVLRADRYLALREDRRLQVLRRRAAGRPPEAPPPRLPATAEVEAAFPELADLRAGAVADLEAAAGSAECDAGDAAAAARAEAALGIRAALTPGRATEAEALLARALGHDVYLQEAYTLLGSLAESRADWEGAAAWYEKGHGVDRGYAPHVLGLARALSAAAWEREGRGAAADDLRQRALAVLEAASAADPGAARLWDMRASVLLAQGQALARARQDPAATWRTALAAARRARACDPGLARAASVEGDVLAALAAWQEGHGADPADAFAESLQAYERALALAPDDVAAAVNLGNLCSARGQWQLRRGEDPAPAYTRAIEAYARVLARNPRDAGAANNQALAWQLLANGQAAQGRDPLPSYEQALVAYGRALAVDPASADVLANQAVLFRLEGDWRRGHGGDPADLYARSLAALDRALALQPGLWSAQAERGSLLEALGRRDEAIAAYESALRICPGEPHVTEMLEQARKRR